MTPAIQAMRDWLRTCPLVASAQEDGVAFRVGGLTGDAEEYTILDMPGASILEVQALTSNAKGKTSSIANFFITNLL